MKRGIIARFARLLAAVPASILKARPLGLIIAPKPSHSPDFPNRSAAVDEAQHKSDASEIYIKRRPRRDGWQRKFGIVRTDLGALVQATHLVDQQ